MDVSEDELVGVQFGVFVFIVVDGDSAIEKLPKLLELSLVETVGEGIMLFKVFFESEVVLFRKSGSTEQILNAQVLTEVLHNLPAIEKILPFLHLYLSKNYICYY